MSYASQQFLVSDNSSIANFKSWGSAISAAIGNMGWIQQNDTGQVVWTVTVLTLTQATRISGNTKYNYSSFTGPAPRIGMSVIITGFATGGNNVTATITALTPGVSGDFTVVNGTGANETHSGSATTTVIAAVPGSSAFTYEVWAPNDALQTGGTAYFMKFEYGTSTTTPSLKITLCTSTDGAGTATGTLVGPYDTTGATITNLGSITWECYFSGDTNRLGMLLWRNRTSGGGILWIGIERTKGTDGTDSTDGVTLWLGQLNGWNHQQSLIFGVGATANTITSFGMLQDLSNNISEAFNGTVPVYPIFPFYGKVGNPATIFCGVHANDIADLSLFRTTIYGITHTYLVSSEGTSNIVVNSGGFRLGMRFD